MSDYKRSVSSMDTASGASMSKRRKTSVGGGGGGELELCSSGEQLRKTHLREGLHDVMVSPASSVNSAETVISCEVFSDRLMSCLSSNVKTSPDVADSSTTPTPLQPLDLEAKGFETVEPVNNDLKLYRDIYLLNESSGDSEETTIMLPAKSPTAAVSKHRNKPVENMPPKEEIEEFFAMAEKYEQKRFAEKYNYDIARDMPLDGRYQWFRLI